MADEIVKKPEAPAESPVPAKTPKPVEYVGPMPAPIISNLPDDANKYPANELPERHREFVIRTIPAAKNWWK